VSTVVRLCVVWAVGFACIIGCIPPARSMGFASACSGQGGSQIDEHEDDDPALEEAKELFRLAQQSKRAKDLDQARTTIAAAIDLLLEDIVRCEDEARLIQLGQMSLFAFDCRNLRAAERALRWVLEVREETRPDDHPELQTARSNLALTIAELGNLPAARTLQEKVLEVRSKSLSADDPRVLSAKGALAATLHDLGDLEGARTLQESVLDVLSRTHAPDDIALQLARSSFARTISALGDLPTARSLQETILEVLSKTLPSDAPPLQMARANLAISLAELGDLPGARTLQERVLEDFARTVPEDDPYLQSARGNLALTLRSLGEFAAARKLQEKVLETLLRTMPPDHPDLQLARLNLANTMSALGELRGARALEEKVLESYSRTLPDDHPDLQLARNNFAITLEESGDLPGARALQEKVLEVLSSRLPDDHFELRRAQRNLADTIAGNWASLGRDPSAADLEAWTNLAREYSRGLNAAACAALVRAPGREAEERCHRLSRDFGSAISHAVGVGVFPPSEDLLEDAFQLAEGTRGAALVAARLARRMREDPGYAALRTEHIAACEEVTRLARSGSSRDPFQEAVSRRDRVERSLVELAGRQGLVEVRFEALAERLEPDHAVVAFRRYRRKWFEPGSARELYSECLCAFVVLPARPNSKARLLLFELGSMTTIENAVEAWRKLFAPPSDRGVDLMTEENWAAELNVQGCGVRALLFDPLFDTIGDSKVLIIVPDDVLHGLPIDALPMVTSTRDSANDHGTKGAAPELLGARFSVRLRLTTSEILAPADPLSGPQTLLALGGAQFNSEPWQLTVGEIADLQAEDERPAAVAPILRGGAWERGFRPLAHSGDEARGVAELFEEAFGEGARSFLLEKRKASRAAVAELAPRVRFLHLATHGWFAPESIRSYEDPAPLAAHEAIRSFQANAEARVIGASPMVLCGLAFAGANLAADGLGRFPGLVTAEEISAWDLSNCELAVLSACDTNVGLRRAGQGVAGLQRALQMAGARTVITSLWKVPDAATAQLMTDFYRRLWIERKPKAQALWEAKMRLRNALDESGNPLYSMRDWAAWVLTGNP